MFSEKTTELCKAACTALGYDYDKMLAASDAYCEADRKSITAYAFLCAVIRLKNNGWVPNYHTGNRKYWTWHWVKADEERPSGFGFSAAFTCCDDTHSNVGARLTFGDQDTEIACREELEELYIAYKL